jgi:hypothetical protein
VTDETKAILATVHGYFDALYDGSVDGFRAVFHPEAQLFTAEGGNEAALGMEDYMTRVAGRASPASRHDPRFDEVVGVTQTSATTAHVRVQDALLPNHFVDDLLLVKFGGTWKIVCKTWAYRAPPKDAPAR